MRPLLSAASALCISLAIASSGWGAASASTAGTASAHIAPHPSWTAHGDQAFGMFGLTSGSAGDINADGFEDLIIGAARYEDGQDDEGAVWMFLGSSSGPASAPSWVAEGNQTGAEFGASVAAAGDVNADGFDDLVVGAMGYSDGERGEGAAFLYLGSPAGLGSTPAWTAQSDQSGAYFGRSVAGAGDVNGDGFQDVIVGAFRFDATVRDEGRAYVYEGSPAGLQTAPVWTADGGQQGARFGVSAETAGDVNGDGYDDVIVGASRYSHGQNNEGAAFVYQGSAEGPGTAQAWSAEGDQIQAMFGVAVGTAGDVNGDGYDDVMVGAHRYDDGQTTEGAVFAYQGGATGLGNVPAWTVEGNRDSARMGESIQSAGDVNRDGFDDVVVAAPHYDDGEIDVGRAYLFQGSPSGLSTVASWSAEGDQQDGRFGCSVGAGDLNGDGYNDVIVGAPRHDGTYVNEGEGYVFEGSPG